MRAFAWLRAGQEFRYSERRAAALLAHFGGMVFRAMYLAHRRGLHLTGGIASLGIRVLISRLLVAHLGHHLPSQSDEMDRAPLFDKCQAKREIISVPPPAVDSLVILRNTAYPKEKKLMENWLAVKSWEGFYEVSSLGRVRSLTRTIVVLNPWGEMAERRYSGRILAAVPTKDGYPMVSFTAPERIRDYRYVHELVATHFIGPRPPGMEVCHRDGIKLNCVETNLRWGTRSSNSLDRNEHGTMNQARGEEHYFHKLTPSDVRFIRENAGRITQRKMGVLFGVTHGTIGNVVRGIQWRHVI